MYVNELFKTAIYLQLGPVERNGQGEKVELGIFTLPYIYFIIISLLLISSLCRV